MGTRRSAAHGFAVERLELGVLHLDASAERLHLARKDELLTFDERACDVGHVEPDRANHAAAIGEHGLGALDPAAVAHLLRREHGRDDGLQRAIRFELGDFSHVREVVEAAWEEEHGVAGSDHAELFELLRSGLANARELRDGSRRFELRWRRCLRGGGLARIVLCDWAESRTSGAAAWQHGNARQLARARRNGAVPARDGTWLGRASRFSAATVPSSHAFRSSGANDR